MEHFDSERAKRVWQRVQSGPSPQQQPPVQPLHGLIQRELSDSALYQQLMRKMQGKEQLALRQLYEQKLRNIAILKGICLLTEGTVPTVTPYPVTDAPVAVLLRRCYGRQQQTLAEYENRKTDPQHSNIFKKLEEQTLSDCCILLELLGREPQKHPGAMHKHH